MLEKDCPICEKNNSFVNVYESNLPNKKDLIDFSGRKTPDGYHYQMVRCLNCDLLYAKEIYEEEFSNDLYEKSEFDYDPEIFGLKKTYSNCLVEACMNLNNKENFLEIGCGNGFMLEEASRMGFKNIVGIEPSKIAYQKSKENIKEKIYQKIFDANDFEKNFFDIIFIAMIVEHVVDINKFLSEIFKILRPGGKVVCICHNERHILAKILKNRHPIINDEHVVVFGKNSLNKIFIKHNFKNIKIKDLKNYYSYNYWLNMLPIKLKIKNLFKKLINIFGLGKRIKGFKAGNIYLIASK
tara:strand:+ start:344 stop:1234 length:891 start_codon:yes stop_codon:yes gene_type:complete